MHNAVLCGTSTHASAVPAGRGRASVCAPASHHACNRQPCGGSLPTAATAATMSPDLSARDAGTGHGAGAGNGAFMGLWGEGEALTAILMLEVALMSIRKVLRPEDTILSVTLSHEQRPRPC